MVARSADSSAPNTTARVIGSRIIVEIALLVSSAFLFAISHPSFLSKWGLFPLAYIAVAPAFMLIHRSSWARIPLYGLLYGFACYALYNYWLVTWHPLAIFIVPAIYAGYFLVFFPILKLIDSLFPRQGYWLQAVAWIGYEYLRTQGFLGYSYGVLGYTQYPFLSLIPLAGLAGIWLVTLIVVFPSALIGAMLRDGFRSFASGFRRCRPAVLVYIACLAGAVIYGAAAQLDLSGYRLWKVALVQQNIDPWRGGYPTYEKSLGILKRLSREALKHDPEIIIWSETSFVPGIDWHTKYRTDDKSYQYVRDLKKFLEDQPVAFVIGNNDGQKRRRPNGEEIRVDYNATVLYRGNRIEDIYRKLRLVQFSEHFPYRGIWTWLHNALRDADIHWYEAGKDYVIFEDRGVRFATPICFEDTFGDLNREFVRRGADVLVNMTNDAWSASEVCEIQHTVMTVFRAVENRRSVVRSTNGGITCIIDPNGRIVSKLPAFVADYLVGSVPVVRNVTTPYTRWGDWLGPFALGLTLAGITLGIGRYFLLRKASRGRSQVGG